MKVAVIYPGLLNPNFLQYYINHNMYIYSNYNVDIFISTYIDNSASEKKLEEICKTIKVKNLNTESYKSIEESFIDFKNKYIKQKYTKDCRPINALSMFYNLKKGFMSIPDPYSYDIIIRNRMDIFFNKSLDLQTNNCLNVPAGGDYRGGLMDLFAYGSPSIMRQYCVLYDYIILYMNENIMFHPETILRLHCIKSEIKIKRFFYDVFLRNVNFTKSAPCYE